MRPILLLLCLHLFAGVVSAQESRWWKGNLHTHSLWSDGDDFPESIVQWYAERGYNFLALSDHNITLEGEKWVTVTNATRLNALGKARDRFGPHSVQTRTNGAAVSARLATYEELSKRFAKPGEFLLIPSEELTAHHRTTPLHLNATNVREPIKALAGTSVVEVLQRNVDAVLEQRSRTGQPIMPHINHPNFGWAITAEDLMVIRGTQFFEVYNGHPQVYNLGNTNHPGTERLWDIVLTQRLGSLGLPPLFGLAVDDSHHYHAFAWTNSNPGRGWVMVRAPKLDAASMIHAMERGDFYASSGVTLSDVQRTGNTLRLTIATEPGVTYRTEFIGTRRTTDRSSEPGQRTFGTLQPVTRIYSPEIGTVLATSDEVAPSYKLRGDELYVRARVISSRQKENVVDPEMEMAWTQPLVAKPPGR